jgi:hypothetical protein
LDSLLQARGFGGSAPNQSGAAGHYRSKSTARCRRGGLGTAPPTRAVQQPAGLSRQPAAGAGVWGQRPQPQCRCSGSDRFDLTARCRRGGLGAAPPTRATLQVALGLFRSGLIAGAGLDHFRFLPSDPQSQREFHLLSCNPMCLSVCHITFITALPTQHCHLSEVKF